MSNLVLIRTLRDSTDPDVRKPLQKMLILECVRNKDRMAVEPIVRLLNKTRVSRDFEQGVTCGALKLVLEKYRFSKSNQQGVLPSYTAISHRPLGSVLALDYKFNLPCTRLLTIRLHQPADVTELSKDMKDSGQRLMFQQRCGF